MSGGPVERRAARCGACADCRFFVDDPTEFERSLPGILALSSGGGDARGDQGLCELHERMLAGSMTCAQFAPRQPGS